MSENTTPSPDPTPSPSPQSQGGAARKDALTPTARKEIASNAAKARWQRAKEIHDPNRTPEALCQGSLTIGSVDIDCYVLDNLKRIIHKRGMAKGLGMKSGGGNVFLRAMNRKGLGSVISPELYEEIHNPIVFKTLNGDLGHGYKGTILIDICGAILDADKAGKLGAGQEGLAVQAEIIIRAAAKLGITALIDEATGHIVDKKKEEYRELFKEFIRDEFRAYQAEFPDKFFDMIYKLYGIPRLKDKKNHPQFFGHFIRKYIYTPLADSNGAILEKLDEKNPVVYVSGGRRYKLFQFLSDVVGIPAFRAHLNQVYGIGRSVTTKAQFDRSFINAFPGPTTQRQLWDDPEE